jgi:glycosyltransferase involved in cell wall biosynthesis
MQILILTQWYPPEPAALMHEMALELQERGHNVQILTGFPNYPSGRLYPGYRLRVWQREKLDGIDVMRVWLYPDHSQSGVKRVVNYLSFAFSAAILGPFLRSRPDVTFVYHPPLSVAIPARWLSFVWRRPFIYQIQDLWPETLAATGMIRQKLVLRIIERIAQSVYRRAVKIIVISKGFKNNLVEKGVPAEKVAIISNWVDPTAYSPVDEDEALAISLGLSGKFNLMFAGNVGEAQGLETVVVAAELLNDRNDVQFVIVGDGVALPRLQQIVGEKGLRNVLFLGRYQSHEMPALYALADVLFLHLKDVPLFQITIPHKLFAYMASEKPIIGAVGGDAAEMILDAEAGIVCTPENSSELARAVKYLADLDQEELKKMGRNGRLRVVSEYNQTYLVGKIEKVLQSVFPKERTW